MSFEFLNIENIMLQKHFPSESNEEISFHTIVIDKTIPSH